MKSAQQSHGAECLLYDPERLPDPKAFSFDPREWERRHALQGDAQGRGAALFVRHEGEDYVLRHYRRGGLLGPLWGDRYLWMGLARTRAWREWLLLARLREMGLPVPRPLIARVVRTGPVYRADLATARIVGAVTLTRHLMAHRPPERFWRQVGAMLRRFHEHGVFHADLNAHNVMVDRSGRLYLIDFDRGGIRRPNPRWQTANLNRFKRSLEKVKRAHPSLHYEPAAWAELVRGYGRMF